MGVVSNMKQHAPSYQPDRAAEPMVIVSPSPHEGLGRALRSAYRDGTRHLPAEMIALIEKLN